MLLGELLGNPKGTKSFSSWSEFTDFVNEMPIKTIQPFVSDFNAFAREGFYGNVVQGLVIKQLEDVVFIFGIAIDGTLIFRKRNYPDVSTWEDPKIIIHSNNWHKIYSKRELGELIGINDTWLRFRDVRSIESQDKLDSMQYSGIYLLTQPSELEYVRNCVLVVIGKPNICCIQKLYNYSGNIYKYRVKWYSNTWGNWQTVSLTWFS